MIEIIKNPNKYLCKTILQRPKENQDNIDKTVFEIFEAVKRQGDKAVSKYTSIFDGVNVINNKVSAFEIAEAVENMPENLKQAIAKAKHNIESFHEAQRTETVEVTTSKGVKCWQEKRPIEKIALYIPGGNAPLFSTVLMLAIPAKLAGCKEIVLCSPPSKNNEIPKEIRYTANLCGISTIFKVGGVQAIAALTFGTETIPQVYKIFGPGNQYVTAAKQLATKYNIAIDVPAGPSELLVLADHSADSNYVAADLLSQAEHGTDSQVVLISTSLSFINEVQKAVDRQIKDLPRRAIAEKSILNSKMLLLESKDLILEVINAYAPEHLMICMENEDYYSKRIKNAGSIFLGNYTPESAGDYASGTNHTLPTNGFSKAYSGVNLDSFTKSMTFQKITKEGLKNIGETIELMANAEGLQAHKNAVSIRLKNSEE